MNTTEVTTAFQRLGEEIESLAEGIARQGADAFRDKRYKDAQALAKIGERLRELGRSIEGMTQEWRDLTGGFTERRSDHVTAVCDPPIKGKRGVRKRLRVTFGDGRTVEEHLAADTFVETLRLIGFPKVMTPGFRVRGIPLVSRTPSDSYQQRRVDGYYVTTHSSTAEKKEMLETLARRLALRLRVEMPE
jgi:uncharacterized protein YukE